VTVGADTRFEDNARMMRRAAFASLGVSVLLVGLKTFAVFMSGSVAVLASFADSALDLFTSTLNLFAIRSALTPADAEHRFGHGKAEPLAGLAQGAFIAGSATFLLFQAADRLVAPQPIARGSMALAVMAFSTVCAVGLVLYQRHVVARTGSIAIGADKIHYLGDIATNAGVIVAIVLAWGLGWKVADPIIAILVAAVLIASAWGVFRQSYDQLMDHELPDSDREKIVAIIRAHDEVKSVHDLRTRAAGVHAFIQFHIELDPQMSLMRAHEVSDQVEHRLCAAFPHAEVIIHQDPLGVEAPLPSMAV
jgi:ferrous-iron efflux pump FieF